MATEKRTHKLVVIGTLICFASLGVLGLAVYTEAPGLGWLFVTSLIAGIGVFIVGRLME